MTARIKPAGGLVESSLEKVRPACSISGPREVCDRRIVSTDPHLADGEEIECSEVCGRTAHRKTSYVTSIMHGTVIQVNTEG